MGIFGFFSKNKKETLDKGLEKTKTSVFDKIARAVAGKSKVDNEVLDNLEEVLITSDVGVDTTLKIIERIEERVSRDKYVSTSELNGILRDEIAALLSENNTVDGDSWDLPTDHSPYVILVVGVNGVGKTTTIGKLANKYKKEGKKVLLVAADTFRAGAVPQLELWAKRTDSLFVGKENADPASVIYDGLELGVKEKADIILIDTAGRLQNKVNLMKELEKINKVIGKIIPGAPHETLLIIDATTGQNGISQAQSFKEITNITGIVLTKLDGTAKGGIVLAIKEEVELPVKFIGLGEGIDDLKPFDIEDHIYGLFKDMM